MLSTLRTATAQPVQGVIRGTLHDTTGAAIANATVTITNEGTNLSQSFAKGAEGSYRFQLVPPDTYTVSAKAPHFAEKVTKGVLVAPGQSVSLDITLALATATTTVDVFRSR